MFKRLSAIFIALIMCMSLMTPAFAASTSDSATITIQYVEEGSTLTAYQIIEPVIDSNGNFVGWKWSSAIEGNDNLATMIANSTTEVKVETTSGTTTTYNLIKENGISLDNVQAIIAQGASTLGTSASIDFSYRDGNYTATASVGSYLVYVTPGEDQNPIKIYNPMVISVDYSGSNSAVAGGVANGEAVFTIGEETASAKSSPIQIDKTVSDVTADGSTQKDYSVGDTIDYVLTTTVPDYSANYYDPSSLTFSFTDTMDKSLTYGNDFVVKKPATTVSPEVTIQPTEKDENENVTVTNYTIDTDTNAAGQTILIVRFTPAFIAANPSQNLVMTYSAELNANATTGYNPNTNTVKLTYTNTPGTETTADEVKYRVYTFSINGTYLVTTNSETSQDTYYYQYNFLKTGESEATLLPDKDSETQRYQTKGGLSGAQFTLYASDLVTELKTEITTDKYGYLSVNGLSQGTYYLVETKAPEGYSLNSTPVKIEISASYLSNGNLASYQIKINDEVTESYTLTTEGQSVEPEQLDPRYIQVGGSENPYMFKNINLSNLPSTGSYGTYAFILVGCVIMATALTMFVIKRKESK